jgi:hypothetical protein
MSRPRKDASASINSSLPLQFFSEYNSTVVPLDTLSTRKKSDAQERESNLRCCDRYLPTHFQSHDQTNILELHSPTAPIQRRKQIDVKSPRQNSTSPSPLIPWQRRWTGKSARFDVPARQPSHPSPRGRNDGQGRAGSSNEIHKTQYSKAQKPT